MKADLENKASQLLAEQTKNSDLLEAISSLEKLKAASDFQAEQEKSKSISIQNKLNEALESLKLKEEELKKQQNKLESVINEAQEKRIENEVLKRSEKKEQSEKKIVILERSKKVLQEEKKDLEAALKRYQMRV